MKYNVMLKELIWDRSTF